MTIKLTNTRPGHFKFWTVRVVRNSAICTWGRIGEWSQSKTFGFASKYRAVAFAKSKASSKIARGYSIA